MPTAPAATRRARACAALLEQVHAITAQNGNTPTALHAIKLKLVALANKPGLFPIEDFEMPTAQGRFHPLIVEDNDGLGLYLTINLPGTLGVKAGVDPLTLFEAVRQGALGRQRTFDRLADQFLPGTYDPPAFALKLAHKDVTLATDLARELNVPMKLATTVHAEMTEALKRGWGARDSRIPMSLQNERAGTDITADPAALRAILARDGKPNS